MKVELLSKEKVEKQEKNDAEMAEVIVKVKGSVVMAVWEAKIKLAEDVANIGYRNVVRWHEALAKLNGEPVNTSQVPTGKLKVGGEEEEVEKVPSDGNQVVVYI